MQLHWKFCIFLFAGLGLLLNACQSHAPEPLDILGYGAAWKDSSLQITSTQEWLEGLPEGAGKEIPDNVLTLEQGRRLFLHKNPELRLARAEAGISEAQFAQAGAWADPVLNMLIGRKSPDDSSDEFVFGAGMDIVLPLSGRPKAERSLAFANLEAAQSRLAQRTWELAQTFETAWVEWSLSQEKVAVLKESLGILEVFHGQLAILAEGGEVLPADARGIEMDLIVARNALSRTTLETQRVFLKLSAMMGLHPEHDLGLQNAVVLRENANDPDMDASALARMHPEVVHAEKEYEVAEKNLVVEIRKQYPDIQISPRIEDEGDETRLALGLGIPTAVWNRNRQGIAEALAERAAARIYAETVFQQVVAQISDAQWSYRAANAERLHVENELMPLADKQVEELKALLRIGELEPLRLRQALADLMNVKELWLAARLEESRAQVRLKALASLSQNNIVELAP